MIRLALALLVILFPSPALVDGGPSAQEQVAPIVDVSWNFPNGSSVEMHNFFIQTRDGNRFAFLDPKVKGTVDTSDGSTTLSLAWQEHDIPMLLEAKFTRIDQSWSMDYLITYDGTSDAGIVHYPAFLAYEPVGHTVILSWPIDLHSPEGDTIHFDDFKLLVVFDT